jgi:hypothetical protein
MKNPKTNPTRPTANVPTSTRSRRRAAAIVLQPGHLVLDTPKAARLIRGTDLDPGSRSFLDE